MKCHMLVKPKVKAMGLLALSEKAVLLEFHVLVETKWDVAQLPDWMNAVVLV